MRYLVAVDGSEESEKAVRYAADHAATFDATLEIVHVLEPKTEFVNGEIVLAGGDKATELGEQTLAQARGVATDTVADRPDAVAIDTQLLTGRPADAIADHARDVEADAIYLGHRGLSEEREAVVGSVAKSVLDKATVPVTVIK